MSWAHHKCSVYGWQEEVTYRAVTALFRIVLDEGRNRRAYTLRVKMFHGKNLGDPKGGTRAPRGSVL